MALKTLSPINGLTLKTSDDPILLKAIENLKTDDNIIADAGAFDKDPINSVYVSQITDTLRSSALLNLEKALISDEFIYKALLHRARTIVKNVDDETTMAKAIIKELPKVVLIVAESYVGAILKKNGKKFVAADVRATAAQLVEEKYNIGGFGSEARVIAIFDKLRERGKLPAFVDTYIEKKEIDTSAFTPLIKEHMITYLMDLNFRLQDVTEEKIKEGRYDEYFALAYNHALKTVKGGDDPIDAFRNKSDVKEWDFTVDEFETVEEQGVIKERILAAGALDYIYELGDNLGVFKLTDFLILNWVNGNIDISSGTAVDKLYRHLKLKDERSHADERAMLYKRVLNKGEGKVLDDMVINETFQNLWNKLMEEVVKYIEKIEGRSGEIDIISKQPVYQAIRELQYNLTANTTGMAPMMTREMYAHLKDCFDILNDEQVISQLATGSRKNMWVVIENLAKQELKEAPNVSAFRTVAVKSNQIFRFVAEFNGVAVSEDKFQEFKDAVEAYIIAQSQIGNMSDPREKEEEEEVEAEDDETKEDDMEDFD
ncbi:MAG: hypothetical protein ACOYXT_02890 [Bacteroidota bacterium]